MLSSINGLPPALSPTATKTAQAPASKENEALIQSQTQSTRVEIRGESINRGALKAQGVEAYKAVDAVKETPNQYASTILGFIEAQIRRDVADGASPDALKSRLEAGLRGFQEGYGQAFAQLSGMGVLDENLRSEIEGTQRQVLDGIRQLAQELGIEIELPETAKSSAVNAYTSSVQQSQSTGTADLGKAILTTAFRDLEILQQYEKAMKQQATYEHLGRASTSLQRETKGVEGQSLFAARTEESKAFSLKLRTTDGDAVTIKMASSQSQSAFIRGHSDTTQIGVSAENRSRFEFSIEGELDEGEMRALQDLLSKVGDISEQFYAGNMDEALKLASDLSFDREEIGSFSLSLNRTQGAAIGQAGDNVGQGWAKEAAGQLDRLMSQLSKAGDNAESLSQPRSLVADLLDWVAQADEQYARKGVLLAPLAKALV